MRKSLERAALSVLFLIVTLATAFATTGASPAAAQTTQHQWLSGSSVQGRIQVGQSGSTYVGIWVTAPPAQNMPVARAPMAVSLVIDTSGSMAGNKIYNARLAAFSLLESLTDGDIVSIYGFDNVVREYAGATVVSPTTRTWLTHQAGLIGAHGGTNLYGGVQAGIARVSQTSPSHPIRRVFVISDGHANIGPSDPNTLGNLAAGATEWGISVTSIGVGIDYDQTTLQAMAFRSSGRVHHLREPQQLASILETEMSLLSLSVAVNAVLEVEPGPGVIVVEGSTRGTQVRNGRLELPLNTLYAGQTREILFRVQIVDTTALGRHPLARAVLRFRRPGEDRMQLEATALEYEIVADARAAAASRAPRVDALIAQHDATLSQTRASTMLRAGNSSGAAAELDRARARLAQAAAAAPSAPSSAPLRERAVRMGNASAAAAVAEPDEAPSMSYDMADEAAGAEGY